MTCFEWQNYILNNLDRELTDPLPVETQELLDHHLKSCKPCQARQQNFKSLISIVQTQPFYPLPPQIRKAPLSTRLPKIEPSKLSFSAWEQIPWYMRILIETTGIILGVFLLISSTPKIRSIYEKSFEKRLTDFQLTEFNETSDIAESKIETTPVPFTEMTKQSFHSVPSVPMQPFIESDNSSNDDDSEEDETIHVGKSQLWRFTLKTVNPDDLRPQIVKTLLNLGVSEQSPGINGVQVPGGVEFDLILSQTLITPLKHALEKLAPNSDENKPKVPGSENFSWYRVKSKRKLPADKSQVVIWLAQPH